MKVKLFLVLIMICWATTTVAQQHRYDRYWIFGGRVGLDFGNLDSVKLIRPYAFNGDVTASIAPEIGSEYLFLNHYVSRFVPSPKPKPAILDNNNNRLDGISSWQTGRDTSILSSAYANGMSPVFLPISWLKNEYWLLHLGSPLMYYGPAGGNCGSTMGITKLKCDSTGCVVYEKNTTYPFFNCIANKLGTVQHSNGRDWWLVTLNSASDTFRKFLLTPNGILGPYYQKIGSLLPTNSFGHMLFNKRGTQLLNIGLTGKSDLFDFDRCTGMLSNHEFLGSENRFDNCSFNPPYNVVNSRLWGGGGFSPDGSLIYLSTQDSLFQIGYDTIPEVGVKRYRELIWADSLNNTRIFGHGLGPDGKYYICNIYRCLSVGDTSRFNRHISVIRYPNRKRKACEFVPDSIYVGPDSYVSSNFPNFPNYYLGPSNEPCNFTYRDIWLKHSGGLKVYPNPVYRTCTLETAQDVQGVVQLYNISGQVQYETAHSGGKQVLELPTLPAGIYFLRLLVEGGGVLSQKIRVE